MSEAETSAAPQTVLVRAPNWLGDCVMALPALKRLREAFPSATILVACRKHLADCFSASPDVDEVVLCPASGGLKTLLALWREGGALRHRHIDAGILLTNSFSSGLWLWRTGARRRIGFARDGRGMFLTEGVTPTPELLAAHQADYYLHLGGVLGAKTFRDDPQLTVPQAGLREAEAARLAAGVAGDYVVMAPTSAFGPVKDWLPERYAAVAKHIHQAHGWTVLLTGTPRDADVCEMMAKIAGGGVISMAGKTGMAGFLGLVAGSCGFVGGDSGGAHVAAALGKPTVAIFGITEPSRTRALGKAVVNVGRGGMTTPDLHDPAVRTAAREALEAITADEVTAAFNQALMLSATSGIAR